MAKELFNCDFCGRDTPNKSRICRHCTGGHEHNKEYASSYMSPLDEFDDESEYDYSENALGPKQMEDRVSAKWFDNKAYARKRRRKL